MSGPRYVCVHGHFYQPPRENPWLEAVERQDSAWPAHDWNERVTDECYGPNATARILDREGRIDDITNNYARISFNLGPTLLSWLEEAQPRVYAAVLDADRESRERFGGHGSAIGQVYNHMIMPLASPRDRVTQVRWGLRDFERRFGRRPEGMWLAETAVDTASLEVLAEHGIAYTILAPHQCARVRAPNGAWVDTRGQRVDPRRPYLARLPSGRSIALFFYDGPIARAVAFERLLDDGHRFAERLLGAFDGRAEPQLVHIATDGETYGHHHAYGEMALAVALARIEETPGVQLVNYGQMLELHPPTWEAVIAEDTSWSCMHGVERWRSDCGCNSGTGWHQKWRAPLRAALDWLAAELEPRYEREAGRMLADPWAARDAYIDVVLDRSAAGVQALLGDHAVAGLDDDGWRRRAVALLEMQRHLMLMYTSCGWFFDEPSGLETIQVLRYAARAIQLAYGLFGVDLEAQFRQRLAEAPSNRPEYKDANGIYRELVRPSQIDLEHVAAHFAIASIFDDVPSRTVRGFDADMVEHDLVLTGSSRLATGRLRVQSRVTLEAGDYSFAVLHLGDHNLIGGLKDFDHPATHVGMHGALRHAFDRADITEVVRQIHRHFDGRTFSLRSLFPEDRAAVLERLLEERTRSVEQTLEQVYEQTAPLMRFLQSLDQTAPDVFRVAAEYTVQIRLHRVISAGLGIDLAVVSRLLEDAVEAQIVLDPIALGRALLASLNAITQAVVEEPESLPLAQKLAEVAAFVASSPWKMELAEPQEALWRHMRAHLPAWRLRGEDGEALRAAIASAAVSLRVHPPRL
ncbi:MAG: DUF3536 domain-containing protein [Sandaracinaceae bacterium]|nr:DUF3536 domain-containing protein [Sandaracinaceae bacterium]